MVQMLVFVKTKTKKKIWYAYTYEYAYADEGMRKVGSGVASETLLEDCVDPGVCTGDFSDRKMRRRYSVKAASRTR